VKHTRLAIFIWSLLFPSADIFAQSTQLSIQFFNGKTVKPLKNVSVLVNRNTWPDRHFLGSVVLRTDSNGIVMVQASRDELITAHPYQGFGRNCETNTALPTSHAVQEIITTGVVGLNRCGAKLPPSRPGKLTLAFRKETFLEALGDD
jgi:hypothetical protein